MGSSAEFAASAVGVTKAQSAAVENIQATTKWLIGAIGAVAVALLAGVQLSAIGKLHGDAFEDGISWAGLAMLGVVLALVMATRVLVPAPITLGALLKRGRLNNLGKGVLSDPPIEGRLTLQDLEDERKEVAENLETAQKAVRDDAGAGGTNRDVVGRALAWQEMRWHARSPWSMRLSGSPVIRGRGVYFETL